ncbi:MAG: ABC transporter permease [Elusimicrobiota bacterium]
MSRPGFRRQLDLLTGRQLAVYSGSAGTLLLMCVQAPLIGYFIGLAWKSQEAAPQTYFIMAVAAVWMGCMNACTAIVQERQVFARERMFDLDIRSYLLSKLSVLCVICCLQSVLLLAAQGRLMHLKDSVLAQGLLFLVLSATGVAASALGLLISSFARTSHGAAVAVPILLIPQVIFSEALLQQNIRNAVPSFIEKLTLTKWCYEALLDIHKGAGFLKQTGSLLALSAGLVLFLALAFVKLRMDEA